MQYDILSLGPARMDVFVSLPEDEVTEVCSIDKKRCMIELGFGEKIPVKGVDFAVGGNAGNNAVGITRMGLTAAVIGAVGDGWTDREVIEILKKEGVETRYMEIKGGQKGFGVVINYQGERTILSYYSHSMCCWPEDSSLRARWIYLTSMGEGFEDFYKQAVDWAIVTGAQIAFNPGTRQIKKGAAALDYAYKNTKILFVNREEGADLLQVAPDTEIRELLSGLSALGPATVVVTDGPGGTYLLADGHYYYMPIVPAKVIERTGAGDAFGSGFLAAVLRGKNWQEALRWGTVNSASVLGAIGPQAGLLTPAGMEEWIAKSGDVTVKEL